MVRYIKMSLMLYNNIHTLYNLNLIRRLNIEYIVSAKNCAMVFSPEPGSMVDYFRKTLYV